MSQACGKIPSEDDGKEIRKSSGEIHGRKFQGDIGENDAANIAVNDLGLNGEFFDPKHTGIDSVYRDDTGTLVLLESKLSVSGQLASTRHGRQGSVEWIAYKAELMCDPNSSLYSPDNAKIGEEILRVGPENVHYVKVHRDPETLELEVDWLR